MSKSDELCRNRLWLELADYANELEAEIARLESHNKFEMIYFMDKLNAVEADCCSQIEAAILVEREACAVVCDSYANVDYCVDVRQAAIAIRERD